MTAAGDGPSVIVSGTIAGTPHQGGATWAVLQYLLGLRKLACDVHFIEELDELEDRAVRYCAEVMKRFGLERRWALVPRDGGEAAGMSQQATRAIARNADVLLNVSGMLQDPDVFEHVPIRVYVDLDPAFIQLWHAVEGVNMRLDGHTHFVSVADGIGRLDCPIPTCGREWLSTLPPVVLDQWPVADLPAPQAATTVGHWRSYGSIEHDGIKYGQKAHAMRQLIDLPRHTDVRFLMAFEIHPNETRDLGALEKNGWTLLDPAAVASTPEAYRRFVQGSWAELGVVKSGYVVSRSGWFSDRSACYLASGRPVIAHDTGFARRLPTGDGLFAFSSVEDAVAAIAELKRDYERHRRSARALAEEHLDSENVLRSLLEDVCQ